MTRNLKALGLALFAVLALGAAVASAASAEVVDHFTSGKETTIITGEQVGTAAQNVFGMKSSSLEVTCENAKSKYGPTTITGKSLTEITTHPSYGGCTAGIFGSAPVDTEGCNYILTTKTDPYTNTSGKSEGEDGTVSVECETGKTIKITGTGCTVSIPGGAPNVNLLGVKYDNEGTVGSATRDVKVTATVDKIHYTSSGSLCGLAGVTKEDSDGFLTERVTVKGFEDNGGAEGAQIGVEVD